MLMNLDVKAILDDVGKVLIKGAFTTLKKTQTSIEKFFKFKKHLVSF